MRISERDEIPSATPMVSMPVSVPIDNTPYSPMAMFAMKVYVFGGLAFMVGVIAMAILFWIWVVVIKREYANSPPWLELHPERMRAKEKARIERLKQQKVAKEDERKRRRQQSFDEKFVPPPLRFLRKEHRNRSSSLPIIIPSDPGPSTPTVTSPQPRKSSISKSLSPSKGGKRVSWASSTSELDSDGHKSERPTAAEGESHHRPRKRASSHSVLMPIPALQDIAGSNHSFEDSSKNTARPRASSFSTFQNGSKFCEFPSSMPQARTSIPHATVSVEPRSRRGQEMIAATTPEIVSRWATANGPSASTFRNPFLSPPQYRTPQL